MEVKTVVGFDGGTRYDYETNTLKKGFERNQKTWRKYAPTKAPSQQAVNGSAVYIEQFLRKRMGKRTYKNGHWSAVKYYNF